MPDWSIFGPKNASAIGWQKILMHRKSEKIGKIGRIGSYRMSPVNCYDSKKGIYKMAYTNCINSFYLDFDEFVEYRAGDENAELFLDLTDEIIDEDKLKTHLLQPLKHHVGKFIFKDVKCKSFYEDKIGMKSGLFISLESQKYTQMTKLERSIDLDTYLRKFSD